MVATQKRRLLRIELSTLLVSFQQYPRILGTSVVDCNDPLDQYIGVLDLTAR